MLRYGHHDVMPPGRADDKGGVIARRRLVPEGGQDAPAQREIRSRNLGCFLEQYWAKMAADFIVLTDTRNYDVGHPALTYQLRGICQVDVEVQGLHQPLHSGNSGSSVPDSVQIRPSTSTTRSRACRGGSAAALGVDLLLPGGRDGAGAAVARHGGGRRTRRPRSAISSWGWPP